MSASRLRRHASTRVSISGQQTHSATVSAESNFRFGCYRNLLYGLLGAAGPAALVPVLQGPPRGAAMGARSFGAAAAVLLAAALLAGLGVRLARRRRPGPVAFAVGVHATLAVSGFVVLAAYAAMPA